MENEHILAFIRTYAGKHTIIFANFSESSQTISLHTFKRYSLQTKKQLHGISKVSLPNDVMIEPLDFLVFG